MENISASKGGTSRKRPEWLKVRYKPGQDYREVEELLASLNLHTVCEEAACPNKGECFNRKTATFMILGRVCTRNCRFCNVTGGIPEPVDKKEPEHIAEAVGRLGLRHVVITSVTRDDLTDGGSGHFAEVIESIREIDDKVVVEVLIPDFKGNSEDLERVITAGPHIINHNVETVPRLYGDVRPQAEYDRSLELLRRVKEKNGKIYTKSGLMLGLGEKEEEVLRLFKDLRDTGCDFLTVGQYLSPSSSHYPVMEWVEPDRFDFLGKKAEEMGFLHVSSAPLVRSSYLADEAVNSLSKRSS